MAVCPFTSNMALTANSGLPCADPSANRDDSAVTLLDTDPFVPTGGTQVPFTLLVFGFTVVAEQFWGRATQLTSRDSNRSPGRFVLRFSTVSLTQQRLKPYFNEMKGSLDCAVHGFHCTHRQQTHCRRYAYDHFRSSSCVLQR
jgi:hypothetical protein